MQESQRFLLQFSNLIGLHFHKSVSVLTYDKKYSQHNPFSLIQKIIVSIHLTLLVIPGTDLQCSLLRTQPNGISRQKPIRPKPSGLAYAIQKECEFSSEFYSFRSVQPSLPSLQTHIIISMPERPSHVRSATCSCSKSITLVNPPHPCFFF